MTWRKRMKCRVLPPDVPPTLSPRNKTICVCVFLVHAHTTDKSSGLSLPCASTKRYPEQERQQQKIYIKKRNDNDLSGRRTHTQTFQCARNCILRQNGTLRTAYIHTIHPPEMKTHARTQPFQCWKQFSPTTKTSTVTRTHASSMNLARLHAI